MVITILLWLILTYLTAPSKSAVAPFGDFNLLCRVASVAAHQIAT